MSPVTSHRRVRMLWPDHLGLARGKYLPTRRAEHGSGFCVTTFGLTYDRDLVPAPGSYMLEGLRDVHGAIDASSLHPSWEDDGTAVAVADLSLDGAPYAVSARHALKRAIADWEALGHSPKVGIELEGYLLEPDGDGGWRRFANPRSMVYGTGRLGDPSGFLDEVLETAERVGFTVESSSVEFDEAQFELTLEYGDALAVADDAFLFRVMVREIALARGLDFTFLGKPFPTVSGSGLHVNFSMADADGRNAFYDPQAEHGLADLARYAVAGLVEHHRALIALTAPTVNAYRRLQPGTLAGYWANWGVDHRNVSNRIPAESGQAMRVESRVGDGAMNVHLGVAAVLRAAWLGVTSKTEPPAAYTGDGFEDGGTDVTAPTSLAEALDALEADTVLAEAVGAELVGNYVAVKRAEVEKFEASGSSIDGETLSQFEKDFYLPYH